MKATQLLFSLFVGVVVTGLGFSLSLLGSAGFSLAMVGMGIVSLSIMSWFKTIRATRSDVSSSKNSQPAFNQAVVVEGSN